MRSPRSEQRSFIETDPESHFPIRICRMAFSKDPVKNRA